MIPDSHPLRQFFLQLVNENFHHSIGLRDPQVSEYVGNMLTDFSEVEQLYKIRSAAGRPLHDVGEMLLEADPKTRSLRMRLDIRTAADTAGAAETNSAEFWTGYFDFPMIDNTRLPHDQRAAVGWADGAGDGMSHATSHETSWSTSLRAAAAPGSRKARRPGRSSSNHASRAGQSQR